MTDKIINNTDELTEGQAVLRDYVKKIRDEKRYEHEDQKAAKDITDAERTQYQHNLKALSDMAKRYSEETLSGYTHAAGLMGDMVKLADLWGKVLTFGLNEQLGVGHGSKGLQSLLKQGVRFIMDKNRDELFELPGVNYSVTMNNFGKFDITVKLNVEPECKNDANRAQVEKSLATILTELAEEKLKENGYEKQKDGGFKHAMQEDDLTLTTFSSLTGLAFQLNTKLNLTELKPQEPQLKPQESEEDESHSNSQSSNQKSLF